MGFIFSIAGALTYFIKNLELSILYAGISIVFFIMGFGIYFNRNQ